MGETEYLKEAIREATDQYEWFATELKENKLTPETTNYYQGSRDAYLYMKDKLKQLLVEAS